MSAPIIINWKSNVFPGILGTHLRSAMRARVPALRVEEGSPVHLEEAPKPEPVAICRLKRVAADYKGRRLAT